MSPPTPSASAAPSESVVAVIIPVFDSGATLPETLDSVRAQTHERLRIVVVDDGSTDPRTLQLLDELRGDDRLQIIRQDNAGPSAARNAGIRASEGAYFLPLDSDDRISPTYVAEAVAVLDARPDVALVYARAELFGRKSGPWPLPDFDWSGFLIHNQIFDAALFRRADWAAVGGYDETMRRGREDHDFVMRVLGRGGEPHRIDAVRYYYRIGPDGSSVNSSMSREDLIAAHSQILRNNLQTYADHAEDLFAFVFRQHDEIMDLRYRYALPERIRRRFPRAIGIVKAARDALRRGARAVSAPFGRGRDRSRR
ncbi:MAG: glycosyltransferase family 2 protein [Microbacterium sp.]|uniref:glycosyltransferase family A protein n=1 Tax=Microbacterium sp. TaxID=51671 RepID=UPI0028315160|nr:glycosyltransferase family A protein [Microbacterium sp.]MDR2322650.1 glycosyltransferase family 2 protein [Microbacterium sp.]